MDAGQLGHWDGQQSKWVVLPEIGLAGERQVTQIGKRMDVAPVG
jgi:hypothetical protein